MAWLNAKMNIFVAGDSMSGTADTVNQSGRELRVFVANCLMGGDEITRNGDNWIRDRVVFNCGGRSLLFRQKPEIVNNQLSQFKDRFAETTEVVVTDVVVSELQDVLAVIDRICWLLSFVGTCRVMRFGYEYPNGSGFVSQQSVSGIGRLFRPVLNINNGIRVKSLVEQAYDKYTELEQVRKLPVVIDYLAQAEAPSQPIEIKAVLAFVALESLKHTFAVEQGIRYEQGAFRKPAWVLGENNKKSDTYTFKQLVRMMLSGVNMSHNLDASYRLRNELIHSGFSSESFRRKSELYEDVYDLIREYILRLLGYRGPFSLYSNPTGDTAEIK